MRWCQLNQIRAKPLNIVGYEDEAGVACADLVFVRQGYFLLAVATASFLPLPSSAVAVH